MEERKIGLFKKINKDGTFTIMEQYNNHEDMMADLEKQIPIADIDWLKRMVKQLSVSNAKYKNIKQTDMPGYDRVRRKIYREIENQGKYIGTAPTPNSIVRNSYYTTELIGSFTEDGMVPNINPTGDPILAEEFEAVLSKKEAGQIIDSINSYIREYYLNGSSPNITLDPDGKYYVLKDTFNTFCSKANISGPDRRAVREALFPKDGKRGLLEQVKFIFPKNGKHYSMRIRFISARRTLEQKRENRLPNEDDIVKAFEMDINAGLYSFLEQREEIIKGKAYLLDGFQQIPLALTAKIDRSILLLEQTLLKAAKSDLEIAKEGYILHRNIRKKGSIEKFRRAVIYAIDKWNTGKQKRKTGYMKITWVELHEKGIFPANTKKKNHRKHDMDILLRIAGSLAAQKEAFIDCKKIDLDLAKQNLVFTQEKHE